VANEDGKVSFTYRCLRDIVFAIDSGADVDKGLLCRVTWEHDLIRQAIETPHAIVSLSLPPAYFEVKDYRMAWTALLDGLQYIKPGETFPRGVLLSKLTNQDDDDTYFRGHAGSNWIEYLMMRDPCGVNLAIEDLIPRLHARHDMKHWRLRSEDYIERINEQRTDPVVLHTDWRMEAYSMSQTHDGGAIGKPVSQLMAEWDPENKENRNIIPLGIPQIDKASGGGHGRGELMVVGGGTNHGKCLQLHEKVLMYDGTVRMVEDVVVGDRLMGPDGSPRRVLTTKVGRGEMYEVRPASGSSFFCNIDHILTLVGTGKRAPTATARRQGKVGTRYGGQVVDVSVREWMKWSKKRKWNFKLMRADAVEFGVPRAVFPIDPYFLGVLIGDGSIQHATPNVTTADEEIVEEIRLQAGAFGLRVHVGNVWKAAPYYSLSGKHGGARPKNPVTSVLGLFGLAGSSSGTKFIPQIYKTSTYSDRMQLLAGLMDTDGAVNDSAYDFISKSKRLADDVAFVARSLGMAAYVAECRKGCQTGAVGTYYRVGISGNTVADIPVRIPRKKLPKRMDKRDRLRTGFQVIPTGKVEDYYGFMLDGDGRFLLGDFTVTHNSFVAQRLMRNQAQLGNRALYISVEDSQDLFICRFIADFSLQDGKGEEGATPPAKVRDKSADPEVVNRTKEAAREELGDSIFYFHAKKWPVSKICDVIRRHRHLCGIDVVIVDYLQAIMPDEVTNQKANDTAFIVAELKKCCDDCEVALILMSQYARDEYRNGVEPTITSCKWAGEIENEAEIMLLLWRDDADILHARVAKLKWARSAGRRYIIHVSEATGCMLDWEDDFSVPQTGGEREKRNGRRRGERGSPTGEGTI